MVLSSWHSHCKSSSGSFDKHNAKCPPTFRSSHKTQFSLNVKIVVYKWTITEESEWAEGEKGRRRGIAPPGWKILSRALKSYHVLL